MSRHSRNILYDWVDLPRLSKEVKISWDAASSRRLPDEYAVSLVTGALEVLLEVREPPDEKRVEEVIRHLRLTQPSVPDNVSESVFDLDSAHRYLRILNHFAGVCFDYTPESNVNDIVAVDLKPVVPEVEEARKIADQAFSDAAATGASPYAILAIFGHLAVRQALTAGMNPLQVARAVNELLGFVMEGTPVSRRGGGRPRRRR
jgi:hypothetical protein